MKVSSLQVRAGNRGNGWIEVARLASGQPLSIPVVVIAGAHPGPTLGVVAGVHGDEFEGPAAIWQLYKELDPQVTKGTLIGVPHANPPAFQVNSRNNPLDGGNLNRVFPGRQTGTISERIAAKIVEEVVSECDALVDLHSGGQIMELLPLVMIGDTQAVEAQVEELACATGLGIVWHAQYPGTLAGAAVSRRAPALTLEVGGQGRLDQAALVQMKRAVIGVMRSLDMMPRPESPRIPQTRVKGSFVTAGVGGFFEAAVSLGDTVSAGHGVGRILGSFGEEVARIVAPTPGLVCALRTTPSVQPGEQLVLVGEVLG